MAAYRTFDVAVEGGTLRAGAWGTDGPLVLCSHGITGNHVSFEALVDRPELVNESCYGDGWLIRVRPSAADPLAGLLDASAYQTSVADRAD